MKTSVHFDVNIIAHSKCRQLQTSSNFFLNSMSLSYRHLRPELCICTFLLSGYYNPYECEPPNSWGYEITHKDTPQSVALLCTSLYLQYEGEGEKNKQSTAYVKASIFNNQAKPQQCSYKLIKRYRSPTRRWITRETEANLRRLVLERVSKVVSAANTFRRQWILQTADNYTWLNLQNVYEIYMFVLWELFDFRCD